MHGTVGGSPSAAEAIAREIKQAIVDGALNVGDSLPTERALMTRFSVGRSTVREALRVLGAQGLIQVKRGRTGGSYVSHPPTQLVVQSFDMFIKGHEIRLADLVVAREAIEVAAAAQAAICRSEAQLETLREKCAACERNVLDVPAFVTSNLEWHLALVQASNNPLFTTFMESISSAIHEATDRVEFDLSIRKAVVGVHWQIFGAILERDPDAARRRMMRHLNAYSEKLASIHLNTAD